MLRDFLVYTFLRRSQPLPIDAVTRRDDKGSPRAPRGDRKRPIEHSLVLEMNRVIGLVILSSLLYIMLFPVFAPQGAQIPKVIEDTFVGSLGFLISALTNYIERKALKKPRGDSQ
jgi:hypothetical protein